jgi:hypothetical protein
MQDQTESWIREVPPAIDSTAVLRQLDRMLRSRHFCNSRRYPAFLGYVVRRTLDGDLDSLKERILGIEVFKRPHDYDTGSDPVVRITAGEVRKRIALYYHDDGTEQELRIELPPGSYMPVFSTPSNGHPAPETALPHTNGGYRAGPASAEIEDKAPRFARKRIVAGAAALVLLAAAVAAFFFWNWATSPVESMWRPFFSSPDPVLIVVGTPLGRQLGDANPDLLLDSHSHVHMSFNDALALTDITGLMDIHRQPYRVQSAGATSLDDLRKRPVVLIAAFGNPWSVRILSPLRFSLLRQQVGPDGRTMLGSVVDHRNGGATWNFDFTKPMTVNSKDYAVVARLRSDLTEGPITVIAGLGAGATESAGEFVTNPGYLQQISAIAPRNWRNKNFELVLEVPMVDGKSGHAHIVASEFW